MDLAESALSRGAKRGESLNRIHTRKSASHVRAMHIHKSDSGYVVHTEHSHKADDGSESLVHSTHHAPDEDSLHDLVSDHMGEPNEGEEELAGLPSNQAPRPQTIINRD